VPTKEMYREIDGLVNLKIEEREKNKEKRQLDDEIIS
jgi:hypothetical protein